ncbi:sulfate/molybdate ABC transporter ATP-binding protein [Promicromonospora citrea]|uniref:Molybdenum ABC transporter ATP-binding protein n=1 Tax=Promicromonospora citrea TaxID=43677 RepID=A0A8H9GHW8_9MICO|nr:ATP-binding cassette domain-containing protein [Promicromonospora citrea]NNH51043.1 ATP-binding cassette domain-containing protein [Promicromonospora citrea]GGM29813.1 molybdenum ABC transporter ATP-binding protein [Promicromonospora citrea]HEV6954730.1 ATP-binding cassette domain-containing protein [Promicromonospora sp.]
MSFRYDAAVAARDVDVALEIERGETLALLGPNGAGKSTVLAVAAGLLRPDSARVELDGRPLTVSGAGRRAVHVPPHDRQIALLSQEPLLFPHLSVLDNVAFGPRSRGASRAAARATARHWLAEVGVEELADRRPAQVSGGQAQRAAVARALAADPGLLLLDEPMAALDVAVTPDLRRTLRRVLADRTVLLVTHDALDALVLADRVAVLEGGRVVDHGETARVLSQPRSRFTAQLAGLNMVTGTWQDGAVRTASGLRLEGMPDGDPQPGDAVVAVFPPRAVSVFREPPGGSPRNVLRVTPTQLEPHAGQVRVRTAELSADITPQAAAELDLAPGARVCFVVKAAEITVYAV